MVKFLEEATMMLDFNHQHILPLLGVSIHKNRPHVILPYMENGDLKEYISNPQNVSVKHKHIEYTVYLIHNRIDTVTIVTIQCTNILYQRYLNF